MKAEVLLFVFYRFQPIISTHNRDISNTIRESENYNFHNFLGNRFLEAITFLEINIFKSTELFSKEDLSIIISYELCLYI